MILSTREESSMAPWPFNVPSLSYTERLFKYFQKENFFKYCFNYWTWILLNSLSEYSSLNLNKAVDTILEGYTPLNCMNWQIYLYNEDIHYQCNGLWKLKYCLFYATFLKHCLFFKICYLQIFWKKVLTLNMICLSANLLH